MATYSVQTQATISSYLWQTPAGMTIIDGQGTNQIDVQITNNFDGGFVKLIAMTPCGLDTISLEVSNAPLTPVFDFASSCVNRNNSYYFSVNPTQGVDNFVWTAPLNSNILNQYGPLQDSIRIKFGNQFLIGTLTVQASNACGLSPALEIELATPPTIPDSIIGSTLVCNGLGSQQYIVPEVAYADYYIWTLPSGASNLSNPPTNDTVQISFNNFISGALSVKAANECGSSTIRYLTITTQSLSPATGISGPTNVCSFINAGNVQYSTPLVAGIQTYNWSVPVGATIVSGAGTNTIQVQFNNSFTGGALSVNLFNGCSVSSPTSIALVASTAATLGAIQGPSSVCQQVGIGTVTYTVAAVVGAQSYNWSFANGSNASIISGAGTNTIQVQYSNGFIQDTLKLTMVSNCGPNATRTYFVTSQPNSLSSISGPSCVSIGQSISYSVSSSSGATTYNWVVPTGMTITNGQNTTAITVSVGSTFTGGNVQVSAMNNCGTTNSISLTISTAAVAPTIINGISSVCDSLMYTYSVPPVSGALYYIWQVPAGMSIVGPTDGISINVWVSSFFVSGKISCKSVTGCGSSPMRYSNTISLSGGCGSSTLAQHEVDLLEPEYLSNFNLFEKVFVSSIINDTLNVAYFEEFENEQLNVLIWDKALKTTWYQTDMKAHFGTNSLAVDLHAAPSKELELLIVNEYGEIRLVKTITIPKR
jgi:hypothetical protein